MSEKNSSAPPASFLPSTPMKPPLLQKKLAGLLAPVFAMRRANDCGIGDTLAVMEAIDFCAAQQFAVLQLLPVHETVGDHSPYNPISSRALSPSYITLEEDWTPGLKKEMIERLAPEDWLQQLRDGGVKHRSVHTLKAQILKEAYSAFDREAEGREALVAEFNEFIKDEADWLPAYSLFRLLVEEYNGNVQWEEWRPEHHRLDKAEAWLLAHPEMDRLASTRESFEYMQWVAHRQWLEVRRYADTKGVLLMGEMSFGVSKSSADVWAHPELFDIEWSMGTRPVSYFDTNKDSERWGQNWGLPPYRWENHRSEGFKWLRSRLASEARFFHLCRLDHLRGYFRGYMFPWQGGAQHAEFVTLTEEEVLVRTQGRTPRFVPGPDEEETSAKMNELQGRELITVMQEAAGAMGLFAELMGLMPDYMRKALEELQMPNLTFPLLEKDENGRLLHRDSFRILSLVAYGNHDHAAIATVYSQLLDKAKADPAGAGGDGLRNLLEFAQWTEAPPEVMTSELLSALQKALFETPCCLATLMCTDLLGSTQRFNLPGSYGHDTWCDRIDLPWGDLLQHPVFGERVRTATQWVIDSGRQPSDQPLLG